MNVYIDLTLIRLFLNGITSFYFIKNISLKHFSFLYYFLFGIYQCFQMLFLYQNFYLTLLIYLLIGSLLLIKKFKKSFIFYLLIYIGFSYISDFLIFLVFKSLIFYRGIFIISKSEQIFSVFAYPLLLIIIFIVSLFVDNCFRLRNYKEKVIIILDNKKYILDGYMDSGNLAKYDNSPIIFVSNNCFKNIVFDESIEINSINGRNVLSGKKGLISIGDKNTFHFIYICKSQEESFNGCDCLLNVYLS